MINPFKEIQSKNNVPKVIKGRVLDDVAMIKKTVKFHKFILKKYPNILSSCMKK